jgi:hypothetical protein
MVSVAGLTFDPSYGVSYTNPKDFLNTLAGYAAVDPSWTVTLFPTAPGGLSHRGPPVRPLPYRSRPRGLFRRADPVERRRRRLGKRPSRSHQLCSRLSSLRRNTCVTRSAISATLGGRSCRRLAMISRTCGTVMAGVFPPQLLLF